MVLKNISALIHVVDHTCIHTHTCTYHFFAIKRSNKSHFMLYSFLSCKYHLFFLALPFLPLCRTAQLRRSLLSSNSSPILLSSPLYGKMMSSGSTAASGSAHSSRSLVELLSTALGSGSHTSSPAHLTPSSAYLTPGSAHPIPSSSSYSQLSQSLPRLCSDNIGKLLSFKEGKYVTVNRLSKYFWDSLLNAQKHSLYDMCIINSNGVQGRLSENENLLCKYNYFGH